MASSGSAPRTIALRDAAPGDWAELMRENGRGQWNEIARTPYRRQAGVDAFAVYSRLRRLRDGRAQFDVQNAETVRLPHGAPRVVFVRGRATQMSPHSLDATLEIDTTVRDAASGESVMPAGVYPPASGVRQSVLRLVAVGRTVSAAAAAAAFNVALVASPTERLSWILRSDDTRMTTLDYDACARALLVRGYAAPSVVTHALVDVPRRQDAPTMPPLESITSTASYCALY